MKAATTVYLTTPIYYVTDKPHIGHLYTTVAADVMARYHRLRGKDVRFLTGTDEHGQKCQKKAKENNESPQALADRVVERYREAWALYGIQYDDFIRTTEVRHKKVVTEYIGRLMKSGDIYLSEYEGWYCVPDESYWTDSQLVDGKCPECGRPVERLKEECYFFRMSAYAPRLLEYIEKNPSFILPDSRRNEVLGFLRQGVRDISVSRTTISWGIPMPVDPKATKAHTVYVWFDALTNYVSALSPLENSPLYTTYWPQAEHLVGKDILRFHAVYWPTFLMALGLPLPKRIVAHGWLTDSSRKISKSLGNVIDPIELAREVGVDGMRFFLFREFVFGQDGEYTKEILVRRINSDLANDYGNAVSRVASMVLKYLGDGPFTLDVNPPEAIASVLSELDEKFDVAMRDFHYERALDAIWGLLTWVNRDIESTAPWTLAKSGLEADKARLRASLLAWREALRIVSLYLVPFIPTSSARALETLGAADSLRKSAALEDARWAKGPSLFSVAKPSPLFPRIEWKPQS